MICPLCEGKEPAPYPDDGWEPPCYLCEDAGKVNATAAWLWAMAGRLMIWGGDLTEMARKRAAR